MADAEPLEFLNHNKKHNDSCDSEFRFPSEFPYEFEVSSPTVESVAGSTETDTSDEDEDFLAGLTRRLSLTHQNQQVPTTNTRDLAGSPQSTLSGIGSWSSRSTKDGNPNGLSRIPSQPTTATFTDPWGAIYAAAAAGEFARLKIQNQNRVVGPNSCFSNQVKGGSVWCREPKPNWLFQQQQLRVENNRPLSLVYPVLQNHRVQFGGSGSRVILPGGSSVKRGCGGTGVFLPRHYETPSDSQNKTGCAPAKLPVKSVYGLKSYVDDRNVSTQQKQLFSNDYEARRNALVIQQRIEEAASCEIRLPQEWTY